jgi:hypothetical protein
LAYGAGGLGLKLAGILALSTNNRSLMKPYVAVRLITLRGHRDADLTGPLLPRMAALRADGGKEEEAEGAVPPQDDA